jgi:hypothetical protein
VFDGTQSRLMASIDPGVFVMPDGLVVQEDAQIHFQLIEPTGDPAYSTLIAYRPTDPGLIANEVRYAFVSGWVTQQTIAATPNLVQMPLAWVFKDTSNPNSSKASAFTVSNLGNRNTLRIEHLTPPISLIPLTSSSKSIVWDTVNKQLKQQVDPSIGTVYLSLPYTPNEIITSINIVAKSNPATQQTITFSSKMAVTPYTAQLQKTLDFSSTGDWVIKSILYPAAANMQADLIQLDITTINQSILFPTNAFEVLEVVVTYASIF